MSVVFVDGQAHYTTIDQAEDKYADASNAVVAGSGAFGEAGALGAAQYNVPESNQRDFSIYFNIAAPSGGANLWCVRDNVKPQVWADVQPDGSIHIYGGAESNVSFEWQPQRGPLLGTIPAGSVHFNVHSAHKVKIVHHQTAGSIEYRIDNELLLTLTNVDTAYAMSAPNSPSATPKSTIVFVAIATFGFGTPGAATCVRSHIMIAGATGDIIGNPRLGMLKPDGVGNYSQWTPSAGSNYQNVDDVTPDDDTTYNETITVGHKDSYTMENVPSNVNDITGLAVTVRITKTDANSRMVRAFLRIGGVDYPHSDTQGVPGGYAYLQWIWTLSPATGVAFTAAEVNGLEAGVEVVS